MSLTKGSDVSRDRAQSRRFRTRSGRSRPRRLAKRIDGDEQEHGRGDETRGGQAPARAATTRCIAGRAARAGPFGAEVRHAIAARSGRSQDAEARQAADEDERAGAEERRGRRDEREEPTAAVSAAASTKQLIAPRAAVNARRPSPRAIAQRRAGQQRTRRLAARGRGR